MLLEQTSRSLIFLRLMNIYEWFTPSVLSVCAELSVRYDIIQYLINQNVT